MLAEQLQRLHSLDLPYAESFDDRLLIQLLLCIAAGERNLVVRVGAKDHTLTSQQRKEWVQRVGAEVAWICSVLFALETHRVQCTAKLSTTAFLRSLFVPLPAQTNSRGSELGGRKEAIKAGANNLSVAALKRGDSRMQRRSASVPLEIIVPPLEDDDEDQFDGRQSRMSPGLLYPSPTRRQSSATDSILGAGSFAVAEPSSYDQGEEPQDSSAGEDLYPHRPVSPRQPSPDRRKARPPSPERQRSHTRRQTINGAGPARMSDPTQVGLGLVGARTPPPGVAREVSSPTLRNGKRGARVAQASPTRLSLFNTYHPPSAPIDRRPSIASVQSALSHSTPHLGRRPSSPTLPHILRSPPSSTSPISPTATSPSFLTSPTSPTAPSMPSRRHSAEVARQSAPPPVRTLPRVLILERLERTRPSVQQSLLDVLRDRRISLGSNTTAARRPAPNLDDGASIRTRRTEVTVATTAEGWEGSYNLPSGFLCVAIVCGREAEEDEQDGAWGGVSRHLFDRFSLSHTIPSSSFFRPHTFTAPPPPPSNPLTPPHLSPAPIPPRSLPADFSPPLQSYLSDLLSTLRHHPLLEGRMLTAQATTELVLFTKLWVVLSRGQEGQDEKSMVLPRDVVSVIMGVVGHRLKLREARNEKSLFWGSELGALERNERRAKGVEGVVRSVVGEV